ncbi:uncharacterized protein LOC114143854 isoform X2 [Xiphophorus couchianus]|uniref:uncharacterized protein LOC114143854 isoform X1 n=1 Tax=Xiphophorus couchianus TaxID=32473 RepID=UPI00101665D5|nr:uncharacterized protein LOC114143854 isoform X1 [Xiphophorus couchianus]XP_027872013.1 uncharacterized protein LOC114143854 isoform X2 [Xiphophorus couchianus]
MQRVCKDMESKSPEVMKAPLSISIRDFSLSLSESDKAESDFTKLPDEFNCTPLLGNTDVTRTSLRRLYEPVSQTMVTQSTLAQDDTDVAQKSRSSQKEPDDVLRSNYKIPHVSSLDSDVKAVKSCKNKNPKDQVQMDDIPFIDEDDIKSSESVFSSVKNNMVKSDKKLEIQTIMPYNHQKSNCIHLTCDSTDRYTNLCPFPEYKDTDIKSKTSHTPELNITPLGFFSRIEPENDRITETSQSVVLDFCPFTPNYLVSEEQHDLFSPINEADPFKADMWMTNTSVSRLSSPESVMSVSDYRAMSPDSPLGTKWFLPADFFNTWEGCRELSAMSDKCSSTDINQIYNENTLHTQTSEDKQRICPEEFTMPVISASYFSESFESWNSCRPLSSNSQAAKLCEAVSDVSHKRVERKTLSPVSLEFESDDTLIQFRLLDRKEFSPELLTSNQGAQTDCRPFSPESQSSQCSFSFLDLMFSEPTRSQLRSQYCDYFLHYSGENQTSPPTIKGFHAIMPSEEVYPDIFLTKQLGNSDSQAPTNWTMSNGNPPSYFPCVQYSVQRCVNIKSSRSAPMPYLNDWTGDQIEEEEKQRAPEAHDNISEEAFCEGEKLKTSYLRNEKIKLQTPKNRKESNMYFWNSVLEPVLGQEENDVANIWQTGGMDADLEGDSAEKRAKKKDTIAEKTKNSIEEAAVQKQIKVFELIRKPKYVLHFQNIPETLSKKRLSLLEKNEAEESVTNYNPTKMIEEIESKLHSTLSCSPDLDSKDSSKLVPFPQHNTNTALLTYGQSKISGVTVVSSPLLSTERPLTYSEVVRGISFKSQSEHLSDPGEMYSEDVSSTFQSEELSSPLIEDDLVFKLSRHSPESVGSCSDFRLVSSDSHIPDFRYSYVECSGELTGHRSFTPISTLSDWEGTELFLESLFEDSRRESPQSFGSDFELDKLFSRTLSPDSLSSDLDFSQLNECLEDFRASSPESVATGESQTCSHVFTFRQSHGQHCNYYLQYPGNRPLSPLSILSELEGSEFCLCDMLVDNQTDSPDSLPTQSKQSGVVVSPLVSTVRPLTYAEVVRGISFKSQSDPLSDLGKLDSDDVSSTFQAQEPSRPLIEDDLVSELCRYSPESMGSCSDIRPMSPDSPIPELRNSYVECSVQLSGCQSFTSESTLSDWEGTDLCLESPFGDNRRQSPQSVGSDFELDNICKSRTICSDSCSPSLTYSGVSLTFSSLVNSTKPQTFTVDFHNNQIEKPGYSFPYQHLFVNNAASTSTFQPYDKDFTFQQSHLKSNILLISKLHDPFYSGPCSHCTFMPPKSL